MKDFLKFTLASIVGMMIVGILMLFNFYWSNYRHYLVGRPGCNGKRQYNFTPDSQRANC